MNVRRTTRDTAGYTLVELLISMGIMSLVMAATMTTVSNAVKANDTVLQMSGMNNSLRIAMDIITRDLLQVGSGLPKSHLISVPNGGTATPFRIPGPPGSTFTSVAGDPDINAVIPGPGLGPTINGQATDTITILTADTALVSVPLTAVSGTTVTLAANNQQGQAVNIAAGPDRVVAGQLIWLDKGGVNTLVQVTAVNATTRVLTFASGDSLNLNQTAGGVTGGNLNALNAAAPTGAAAAAATLATRVRMISYYLDTTVANHPRLVRRINNGHPTSFNNTLGTAVATDVEGLSFSYDLADGPTMVRFTAPDLSGGGGGACGGPCSVNMIRKISVSLTGRSANAAATKTKAYRNTLTSQVSLRGMSFFNQFQ
jgi:prepilin-type N-terminal cleavage/methylation domain-containing protein